jgi:molybdate transport repressor ModE-like protein
VLKARDLPLLSVFAAVARAGSFTAAARELGLPKSVVSDNVKQLEQRCGARLLERTTRRLALTEAGTRVLTSARRIDEAMRELSASFEEDRGPSGTLRVATTHDLAARLVAPVVAELVHEHPALRIELVADDAAHDLVEGRFDVAVRVGSPRDSSYVIKRLATMDEPIVAAPALVERLPHVVRPRELQGVPWVRHALVSGESMAFVGPRGQRDELVVSVRAQANTGLAVLALITGGAGVGVLPLHMMADGLAQGALVRLCPGWVWKRVELYALLPSREHPRPSVKAFVAALQTRARQMGQAAGAA